MNISIDIGTSRTSACVINDDGIIEPVALGLDNLSFSIPSAVYVSDDGAMLIGDLATDSRMRDPSRFKNEFKRNLGESIPYQIGGRSFLPQDLYTEFFAHIKRTIEKQYGQIDTAYITHPATFNSSKKDLLVKSANKAGLFNAKLIDEPSSAAMYYCSKDVVKDGQVLLVYDFGGGTFDASIVKYENDGFTLLTTPKGLERCGGIDIDQIIAQDIVQAISKSGIDLSNIKNEVQKHRLESVIFNTAVKVKLYLSDKEVYSGGIDIGLDYVDYKLSRDEFNAKVAGLIDHTIACCDELLKSANVKVSDISAVAMVGGTSKIPLVEQLVRQFAKDKTILTDANMELAVVKGGLAYAKFVKARQEMIRQQELKAKEEAKRQAELFAKRQAKADADRQAKLDAKRKAEADRQAEIARQTVEETEAKVRADRQAEAERQAKIIMDKQRQPTNQEIIEWVKEGARYYWGAGVPVNYPEALKSFRKAADYNNLIAQNFIGVSYEEGKGVAISFNEAFKWYEKAAKQGYAPAQNNLGRAYEFGRGTRTDYNQAFNWYKKAAEQNDGNSQFNLGLLYFNGQGVAKDYKEAEKWYRKAAANGCKDANDNLKLCLAEIDKTKAPTKPPKNTKCRICNVTKNDNLELCTICRAKYNIDDKKSEYIHSVRKDIRKFKNTNNNSALRWNSTPCTLIITNKQIVFDTKQGTDFIPLRSITNIEFVEGNSIKVSNHALLIRLPGGNDKMFTVYGFTYNAQRTSLLKIMDEINVLRNNL